MQSFSVIGLGSGSCAKTGAVAIIANVMNIVFFMFFLSFRQKEQALGVPKTQ